MTLDQSLSSALKLTKDKITGLKKIRIQSTSDLLYHFPNRYTDSSVYNSIQQTSIGTEITIYGKIQSIEQNTTYRQKTPITKAIIIDIYNNKIPVIWFSGKKIAYTLKEHQYLSLRGTTQEYNGVKTLINPVFERIKQLPIDAGDSLFSQDHSSDIGIPIYGETKGITSVWIHSTIKRILKQLPVESVPEIIPETIRTQYKLPNRIKAFQWIHTPKTKNQSESARKYFAFEYLFTIQVHHAQSRYQYQSKQAPILGCTKQSLAQHTKRLPFTLTKGQLRVLETIRTDIGSDTPMVRLLEGDVGSGKTAIAAMASVCALHNRTPNTPFQVAYMAPTEVLATQLFESFIQYFSDTQIVLLTGSGCRKFPSKTNPRHWTSISRTQALKWVTNGEISIVVGTHTLIQKRVQFRNLALVIIDEQHRFGTAQRHALVQKDGHIPHLLSMTATPIPRTLALTLYGNLDLSVLDELPPGRIPVITRIVNEPDREQIYQEIRTEIATGRQLYIICPRIEEPDPEQEQTLQMKSAVAEARYIQSNIFPEYTVGVVHSKLTPAKKEQVMNEFASGKTQILVATSVIEVGVNVPNATMIIIEGAERFGLAQLHQLRGRVMRSSYQPYCYLFANVKTEKTHNRLHAFVTAKNGFELAELDMQYRGAGDLAGLKQWGISDIGMEALRNMRLVEAVRESAKQIITDDPELHDYPILREHIQKSKTIVHFE